MAEQCLLQSQVNWPDGIWVNMSAVGWVLVSVSNALAAKNAGRMTP